ncbi:4Fe-4S dicluster domain-containing protein [Dyella sp.]|uniref:4Fe-4S dicluster domain-containing protein n=1 Tax=Dyella sp. TaxID=1869338 RepID=UPI002D787E51|nr:4Fe-4S dicluster domain-containing protein [Dyella sp.]HET6430886.1 4Fe-4S dicluster domain-containing protein [Dyella sp.]
MTGLPPPSKKKLGLVIDLDTCVGCHACAVSCKEWNAGGIAGPLTDTDPYGKDPSGVWFNRVHSYELEPVPACGSGHDATPAQPAQTLHFPRSCLHCETPACVTVCPTGASYKRAEDGIVLVDEDKCIGCKLCSWACPYGAREYSAVEGVMKKCTLCVDRIYNDNLDEAERQPACVQACPTRARHFGDLGDPDSDISKLVAARGGVDLMPELGYRPTNQYLPPRPRRNGASEAEADARGTAAELDAGNPLQRWMQRVLRR